MTDWSRLFSTSALLSLARVSGAAIGFLTQILLARMLDPHELGLFYSVTSIAPIAALVVALGYPNIATRFISRYRERRRPDQVAGFIRRARRDTFFWAVLAVCGISVVAAVLPGLGVDARYAIFLSALSIIPFASQRIYGSVAIAYRRFAVSHVPAMMLRPMMFAAVLAVFWAAGVGVSAVLLTFITFLTVVLTGLIQYLPLRSTLKALPKPIENRRMVRRWRVEAWPLVVVSALTGLLSDLAVLLASPFMSMAQIAEFGVCLKIAFLVGFTVQASHQVLQPELGDAMARRESGGMSAKMLGASLFPIFITASAILLSVVAGGHLLALFGEEFRAAQTTLTILLVAQFVRAVAGPSPFLLTLLGAQRVSAAICATAIGLLLLGNALLAPQFGAEGAAASVVAATLFWLFATAIALYRTGGRRADIAGLLLRRRALAAAAASSPAE